MKHADALEVRPDKSWDRTTAVSWIQRLSDIETALRAARTCTRILSGGRNDKQLYSESVINRCVGILQTVTEDVVVPLVQLRNSGPSADLFKMVRRNRDAIAPVFACCRELIAVLAELVTKIELLDSVTNTLEFAAAKLTFVDNAHLERDSAIGVKLFDGIRFAAIGMLCQIFINKPDQRQGMLDDILHSHGKLPVGKGSRQFNLSCGASIQPVSALIMRLVQAGAGRVPIHGGSRAAFVCGTGSDEHMEYDEVYTAEKGPAAATALAEERGAQQHATAIQDLEAVTAQHAACAGRTASYIIDFMAKRTVGTTKTGDTPYRSLLDLFVEDLITCLGSPDWPSAELLLQLLMVTMVQLIEAPKTAAPARNLALELLGTMIAAISRLRSHVKDTASAFEGSEAGGLSQYLSGLATHVLAQECQTEQIVAWSGPLSATLEYLQGQCLKDPHLSNAVSFIIVDWASKIRSAYDSVPEVDREQHHELGRLAYRLRLTIDDKRRSRRENTFKAVTTNQARFAFSILMLCSPLCQSFNKIFHVLLGSIASEQATVRSKSLKCVEQVLEIDHSILDGDSAVVQLILDCSSDSSTQVRDSALILLGKCIEMRPSLEPRLIPKIVDRLQDAGVVVRKRAMKLACEIYLRNQNMGLRCAIAHGVFRRIQDPDEGVCDLARQVIERIWFAPFYAGKGTAAVERALMEHVALVVQTHVFQDRNSVLETMILRSFKGFLIAEERRSEAGDTAAAAIGDKEQLTVMGGTGDDDVAGAITQSFLSELTRIALGSQSEHAFLALEVLGSIRRQGLTHPKDIGVTLITLETSTNRKIAEFAFMEHRSLHEKHETALEREYVKAVQSAYNYQRDVVKDPHGATVGPSQSKLHLLMEVLKTSKLKNRQRFLEKFCSQTNFELSEVDATLGLPPHVGFARFILENVAYFEYQTIGEIQTVVDTLEKIVTDTGTAVAQAIESELFNVRVDVDEERLPQDPIAAEPVAATSADYSTAGPRPVAESAGFSLPVEPRRLRQLTTASMVLLSLWEACIYLRKVYNVSTDWRGTNAKVPAKELNKQLNKPPSMIQGVYEDKFWDAVASHMRGLQSGETMMKTCRLLVELMSVGRDLEGAHGDEGPSAPSRERNEYRPERSRKRKASATPRKHKKPAQTNSRPRKRKRKLIAESSVDESDSDWM
ncbi:sister chromatid cohesion protein 2 [Purpureocillium lilacinum]|nr:sister chromatid cohesion protein 2 [Purpureocillium lilacinum]